jgi:hypothetical protein
MELLDFPFCAEVPALEAVPLAEAVTVDLVSAMIFDFSMLMNGKKLI